MARLQMQKSDKINIKDLVTDLQSITDSILSELQNSDEGKVNIIQELYSKRSLIVNDLHNLSKSDSGMEFISQNSEYWDNTILEILKKDKVIQEMLDKYSKGLSNKLKTIYKNKSLLIYKKNEIK